MPGRFLVPGVGLGGGWQRRLGRLDPEAKPAGKTCSQSPAVRGLSSRDGLRDQDTVSSARSTKKCTVGNQTGRLSIWMEIIKPPQEHRGHHRNLWFLETKVLPKLQMEPAP